MISSEFELSSVEVTVKNTFFELIPKSHDECKPRRQSCPPLKVPYSLQNSTGQAVSQPRGRRAARTASCIYLDREDSLATTDVEVSPNSEHSGSDTECRRELSSPGVPQEYETDLVTWNGVTTAMIRNLPCRCTQAEVLDAVHDLGFSRDCAFFHMPFRSGAKQNQGYAFIGFRHPAICSSFRDAITGYRLKFRKSSKTLSVMPAKTQWSAEHKEVAVDDIPQHL
eukprot:TRINITY_DN6134_c0_g1_i1.p1 TRINITY_DN6134_c0_g1~~TRINITY_DN6134_c0_g1_i1.p1  ORF type:complete len:225 (+),score=19.07 TRINITY_DN6134_c0_g1_i1:71-745(+)